MTLAATVEETDLAKIIEGPMQGGDWRQWLPLAQELIAKGYVRGHGKRVG